jgi:hypothetical protein
VGLLFPPLFQEKKRRVTPNIPLPRSAVFPPFLMKKSLLEENLEVTLNLNIYLYFNSLV